MTDDLAKEFCVPNERSLYLNVKLESPTTNLKLEQDSQLDAPLHKKTCVAEPDKYRSKKRNRKAQMLQATIDCVFGLWEKDM